jgi:hypothetical protein
MRKLAMVLVLAVSVACIGLSAHPSKNNLATQNDPTGQAKPVITVKN